MAVTIDLARQVAVVTGGTKGVGRGIATRFADAGATIAVCALGNPASDLPDDWAFLPTSVTAKRLGPHRRGRRAARPPRRAREQRGRGAPGRHHDRAAAVPERIVALNLLAPLYCSQRANQWMQQADGGSIVNIRSVSGSGPPPPRRTAPRRPAS